MKRILLSLIITLFFTSSAFAAEKLVIGVTPFPHKDIMNIVKKQLAAEGFNVVIKEFTDYIQPNTALAEGYLFANFFQHVPYLEHMNKERNLNLVWIAKVHIEPLGLYSKKIKSLEELKKGSLITIPNDPTNEARALRLLEANKLIVLKKGELITVKDISQNPRNLKFKEIDAAQLPRTLDDVTAAVINTNFAGEAGLIPSKDAIIIEGKDSPYANILVVRAKDKDSKAAKALAKAINSKEVKDYIEKDLAPKGIVPAF